MTSDPPLVHAAIETTLSWGPTVRGVRWGNADDKVLFLHEPGSDLDAWGALPGDLARALPVESRVYDLPGHGLSDDPWQPEVLPAIISELVTPEHADKQGMVIAAGVTALAALELAGKRELAGLVCLAPTGESAILVRSPKVPKLFFAGSRAADDLDVARRLAAASGGWAVVTAVPVSVSGTGLLTTDWGQRIAEETASFVRDCLHPRSNSVQRTIPSATKAGAKR